MGLPRRLRGWGRMAALQARLFHPLRPGARIANARGVRGTLGCVARQTEDGRPVLLTAWHVLHGNGARGSDPIWLVDEGARLGRTLGGQRGMVRYRGEEHFVDCAIGSCARPLVPAPALAAEGVSPGDLVTKTGAQTGTTTGVVIEVAGRLLIRPTGDGAFCGEGDSGALVLDSRRQAIGLLWGTTPRGEGVACHLGPVLAALHITVSPWR
jgi:hypothetical protein